VLYLRFGQGGGQFQTVPSHMTSTYKMGTQTKTRVLPLEEDHFQVSTPFVVSVSLSHICTADSVYLL
jgi:hypothetical protein